jgi:hypothetical protein
MTTSLVEGPGWLQHRWWRFVLAIFIFQLAIIFWLGEREPLRPEPAAPGPQLHLVQNGSDELLALTDPTLFALPHRNGFSGLTWLKSQTQDFPSFTWSETQTQQWLQMPSSVLGAGFELFVATNASYPVLALDQTEPNLRIPLLPAAKEFPESSMLRLTGDLSNRRLLTSIDLPSWPSLEILTNTQIQLAVDSTGKPVSVALLSPGSGDKTADSNALWQATRARFAPLSPDSLDSPNPLAHLAWGQMIFDWHTLPVPLTNTTAGLK